MLRPARHILRPLAALLAATLLASGCASVGPRSIARYRFFEMPDVDDPWTPQIRVWQARERALRDVELLRPDPETPQSVSGAGSSRAARSGDLRGEYFVFRAERKRALAQSVAEWIQHAARGHYIPDGPIDHWATLEETLARNGDDCDGLELLAYHALLDLGFGGHEVFRAIVHRPEDGQHHMVTLWFEDPEDPWVIDPTGAMTNGMPRLSEVRGWVPLKLFTEHAQYTVRAGTPRPATPLR